MNIGFTGTASGMTDAQKARVKILLQKYNIGECEFHHGDCVGADAEANEIAYGIGMPVVLHPPDNPTLRAFCTDAVKLMHEEKKYLVRNHDIVDDTHLLIGTPFFYNEILRSGTWATIRYGKKKDNYAVYVVWPDGHHTKTDTI